MNISSDEARKVVEAHYAERGLTFSPDASNAEVLRVYHNLQEEIERGKHVGIRPYCQICDWITYETYWLEEEEEPAKSAGEEHPQ